MKDITGLAVGLIVLGIVAAAMAGSAMPLLIIAAVLWAGAAFAGDFRGRGKRRR
jgi:hypothetical protein